VAVAVSMRPRSDIHDDSSDRSNTARAATSATTIQADVMKLLPAPGDPGLPVFIAAYNNCLRHFEHRHIPGEGELLEVLVNSDA